MTAAGRALERLRPIPPVEVLVPAAVVSVGLVVGATLPMLGVARLGLVPFLLVGAVVLAVATARDRGAPLYVAIVLGLTALPAAAAVAVPLGPVSVLPFEPFLYLAAALALVRPGRPAVPLPVFVFGGLVVAGLVGGLVVGNAPRQVVDEVRPTLTFLVTIALVVVLADTPILRRASAAVAVSLWVSLPLSLLGSLGVVRLAGRAESALTGDVTASGEATRLLTPAVPLAFAALLTVVVLALTGRTTWRAGLPWVVPAIPIVVLAFSRSQVVALAAGMLVALVVARRWSTLVSLLRNGAVALVAVAAVSALILTSPAGGWFSEQAAAVAGRTIGGFAGGLDSRDTSIIYREQETRAALRAVGESPLLGHGLGAAYQLPGKRGTFFGDQAPYFVHDYYLWLLVKLGAVGLLAFLALTLVPLVRIARGGPATGAAATAAAGLGAGWAAVNFFGPQPLGLTGAVVAGAVVGLGWAVTAVSSPPEPRSPRAGEMRAGRTPGDDFGQCEQRRGLSGPGR